MPTLSEVSIGDQLFALIRLQHIDTQIDLITKLRGDLPDEIRDMEDEKAGLETRLRKLRQEEIDSDASRRQSERDVQEAEAAIKKYEEQQLQVRNNREYDALTKEIEAQRQRIVDANLRMEEMQLAKPERARQVEEAEARLKDMDDILAGKQRELDDVLEDTKQEQAELEALRKQAEGLVDRHYLLAYTRLRARLRDGRAVVPLERGAAAGFAVPPQRQVEIKQRKRIIACEHTGRIIVDADLYQEAINNMIDHSPAE